MSGDDDPRVLRLSPGDQVVIARGPIPAGATLVLQGRQVTTTMDIPVGFKLAADDLAAGTVVHRAGVRIGRLTADVALGQLVHLHNLESLYLRTHARGES
ncbi:MAG: UxaA family hydrolase [Phycicoccus sp.]|nr:UxaA family hydrolase [Phycicoccus sp.]